MIHHHVKKAMFSFLYNRNDAIGWKSRSSIRRLCPIMMLLQKHDNFGNAANMF